MRLAFSSFLVAFATTAAGLRILSPAIDQKAPQDGSITVRWESVSTDPPKMDIYLVNQNTYPNTQEVIATGVDTSLGKYTIKAKDVGDVDTGGGYQVNFVSTTGGGILAQSQQFKVTPPKAEASSSVLPFLDYPLKHRFSKSFVILLQDLLYISPFILHVVFMFVFHEDPIFYYVLIFCLSHSFVPHPSSSTDSMKTSTTSKHKEAATSTESASATSTSNAAGYLMPPNQAGSLLLGLFALAL
ncbi:hypothetical protein N7520_006422 [Penicillium odoratum]|uniref:uncharacterized protein n=1 Tax=Penicillium odoratum TaxID=1167516 RepID=UPI0025495364|nr:uncharacterized protein N7520_006422 [Penicillium odoratum]KAJ5759266.1 hypothetical protein N7520_006422 [Penicillium odoratum]